MRICRWAGIEVLREIHVRNASGLEFGGIVVSLHPELNDDDEMARTTHEANETGSARSCSPV